MNGFHTFDRPLFIVVPSSIILVSLLVIRLIGLLTGS